MLQKFLGDRAFYKRVLAIAIPILIQNGITNFVSLLDNIMVGQVGTLQMSGVSIVNQLLFVFNLAVFGLTSGAGIFTAQFHGSKDPDGVRYTFRYKCISCFVVTLGCIVLLFSAQTPLISLFLQGDGSPADAAQILEYARGYLLVMLWGLLPFALSNAYNSTLRECGQTVVPMISGICAVFVNLILNYIFIFGKLGAPAMGVQGAALATVISRYAELAIVAGWTHLHPQKNPFIKGAFRSLRIPLPLLKQLLVKCIPLLFNETLWAASITFMNQCYSTCGLEVMSAINIVSTLNNLANVVVVALSNALGILLGQMQGAGRSREDVRDENRRLLTLAVMAGAVFSGVLAGVSGLFPQLYNTTDSIRAMSSSMILILALMKPVQAYAIAAYYALRSGGKTWITFLFDSGCLWLLSVPLAFFLSRFTDISILPLYFICQLPDVVKSIVGYLLIRSGRWMHNLAEKAA